MKGKVIFMMKIGSFRTYAVLDGTLKIIVRSILGKVYFVIHKYTDLSIIRTLGEYV